jgi:hypothetical protein
LDGIWQAKVPKNSYKLFFAKTTNAEEQVDARYKNNMGPQVRRRRHARGWSQSVIQYKPKPRLEDRRAAIFGSNFFDRGAVAPS